MYNKHLYNMQYHLGTLIQFETVHLNKCFHDLSLASYCVPLKKNFKPE